MKKNICLNSDCHCHTSYSDGLDSPEDMILAAADIGLRSVAITDHVNADTPWFGKYLKEIRQLKDKFRGRISILSGFESKVINLKGELDADRKWFGLVDVVLGSIHSIPSRDGFFPPGGADDKEVRKFWGKAFRGLFNNPRVNIIAHPFAELEDFGIKIDSGMKEDLLRYSRESNKIIEFNLRHFTLDKKLLRKILDSGAQVCIGSDAHSAEELYSAHKKKLEYFDHENTFCSAKA